MSAQLLIPGLAHQITKGIEKGCCQLSPMLYSQIKKGNNKQKSNTKFINYTLGTNTITLAKFWYG